MAGTRLVVGPTSISPTGSPSSSLPIRNRTGTPIRAITVRNRRLVGFKPTSTIVSARPVIAAPATRNAAADGSPGTEARKPRYWNRDTSTNPSRRRIGAPNAASARSVWSLVAAGSRMVVSPSAATPASRIADFTCALGTEGVNRTPWIAAEPSM